MSPNQFARYNQLRAVERRREEMVRRFRKPKRSGETDTIPQLYRTYSLALCTFCFPNDVDRPFKYELKAQDDYNELSKVDRDKEYDRLLDRAVEQLVVNRPDCLVREFELRQHSPKFAALLDRLDRCPGTALVYSEFRRPEGLGLFAACLRAEKWKELRIVKKDDQWSFLDDVEERVNRYIVLRSEEDEIVNRFLLNIFNNEFDKLPSSLKTSAGNLHGETARALLITSSAAEGITLKNVRQVHLIEAFWNHTRIDQVIGRAVRTRSHMELKPEERRVETFLYLADLTDQMREDRDVSLIDKGLSSDQYMYSIAMKKKHLTDQVLDLMEAASVDCRLWSPNKCLEIPKGLDSTQPLRTLSFGDDVDDATFEKRSRKLVVAKVKGKLYYLDQSTNVFYDYDLLNKENALVVVVPEFS